LTIVFVVVDLLVRELMIIIIKKEYTMTIRQILFSALMLGSVVNMGLAQSKFLPNDLENTLETWEQQDERDALMRKLHLQSNGKIFTHGLDSSVKSISFNYYLFKSIYHPVFTPQIDKMDIVKKDSKGNYDIIGTCEEAKSLAGEDQLSDEKFKDFRKHARRNQAIVCPSAIIYGSVSADCQECDKYAEHMRREIAQAKTLKK
jgi:hypothetical protein